MRRGESTKMTMAHGDINMAREDGEPWMPHIALDHHELDERFPPITVPGEEELLDHENDLSDQILESGMKIADKITQEMQKNGRRR